MSKPIDTATGRQDGSPAHDGAVEVIVGYLVTLMDGTESRLPPDQTAAANYLVARHGRSIEPM